jgi:hypothetical protein
MPTANCVGRNSSTLQEHSSPVLDDGTHGLIALAVLLSSVMPSADIAEIATVSLLI